MPKIEEYKSQTTAGMTGVGQGSRISGADMGGTAGAELSQIGAGVSDLAGAFHKRQEQQEISDLSAKLSEEQAKIGTEWKDAIGKADPADATFAERFNKGVGERLDKLGEGLQTREAKLQFQKHSTAMKSHFFETSIAGQVELAKAKTGQDYTVGLNQSSSALLNDPSSLNMALERHSDTLNSFVKSGTLPREAALKLKTQGETELVKASVQGWIGLDPEGTIARINSGEWDSKFDADVKKQLLGKAKEEIRSRRIDDELLKKQDQDAIEAKQKEVANEMFGKLVDGKLTAKDLKNANLDDGTKRTYYNMLETEVKGGAIKSDPGVVIDIYKRMRLPDGDPNKITDESEISAKFGSGLSKDDLKFLRDEFQGDNTAEGRHIKTLKGKLMDAAEAALVKTNPYTGFKDSKGEIQMASFIASYQAVYKEKRKQGKTDLELFTPTSPDYIGNMIPQFTRTPQEQLKDMSQTFRPRPTVTPTPTPGATPTAPKLVRNPGESASDFLKRKASQG